MIRPQTADLMTCATTCTERLRGQEMFLFLNAPPHFRGLRTSNSEPEVEKGRSFMAPSHGQTPE